MFNIPCRACGRTCYIGMIGIRNRYICPSCGPMDGVDPDRDKYLRIEYDNYGG